MVVIGWLAIGALIGWGSGLLVRTPASIWTKVVVGAAGAVIGGWLFSLALGLDAVDLRRLDVAGLAASLLGAVALLAIARPTPHQRERRSHPRPPKGLP